MTCPCRCPHFAESAVRAYKISMTLPMAPVVLVLDSGLQEDPIAKDAALRIPKLTLDARAPGRFRRSGRGGAAAGRGGESGDYRRPRGAHTGGRCGASIEFAETLQAPSSIKVETCRRVIR